jgi:phosphate transport system substrate-binding protein
VAVLACGTGSGNTALIEISGSSTVSPISAYVADEFNLDGNSAQVVVDDPGTGDGFASFCEGEIDIADASRPIRPAEAAACEAAGVAFVELEIALDGITVLTSADNDAVECLTLADLYALLGPESDGVERWDVAESLGATSDLPDLPLDVTAPGVESGTYDAFVELVIGEVAPGAESLRTDYSSQSDDNAIIAGLEGSEGSLGFVGFAFAAGAGSGVRPIAVDGGAGCVEPTAETIADGSYPISRSLYIYVNADRAEPGGPLARYVDQYVTDESLTTLVEEAGYVPLPPDRAAATRARWASRTTGSSAPPEAA